MTVIPIRRTPHAPLDAVPGLWNTSADNPAVQARQARSEETTQFQIDHAPTYAAELARLRSWVADYEIPLKEDS